MSKAIIFALTAQLNQPSTSSIKGGSRAAITQCVKEEENRAFIHEYTIVSDAKILHFLEENHIYESRFPASILV